MKIEQPYKFSTLTLVHLLLKAFAWPLLHPKWQTHLKIKINWFKFVKEESIKKQLAKAKLIIFVIFCPEQIQKCNCKQVAAQIINSIWKLANQISQSRPDFVTWNLIKILSLLTFHIRWLIRKVSAGIDEAEACAQKVGDPMSKTFFIHGVLGYASHTSHTLIGLN